MEVSSSSVIYKSILAISFIVLLSYFPAEGRGGSQHAVTRKSFPRDFLFGVGTSALQIEGSANEGGRGPGVWDNIVRHAPKGDIKDADKFPTMIEHYKRYKEDVALLKKFGINAYRFSISWSRIFPDGTLKGGLNQQGIDFYNHLIDELIANGIIPFVTILHFDYPLHLQTLGGFLNRDIVNHYKDYCQVLFENFGDRVKHWTTLNEPEITGVYNFLHGIDNPSPDHLCQITKECTQAYTVVHNFILCHATAVKLYRDKFQATQGGEIGLVIAVENYIPYSSKPEDAAAAERLKDFFVGWTLEPLFNGDYPESMKQLVGDRLPVFTEEEKILVKGSADFIGVNYYRSFFARDEPNKLLIKNLDNFDSLAVKELFSSEGKALGYMDNATKSFVYPEGLFNVLIYLRNKYQNIKIYITENGISSGTIVNVLKDTHRMHYIASHISMTKNAIDSGVNVCGYFVWSAFDTFEFHRGFSGKQGLIYVDFNQNLKRIPKRSARWYRHFLTGSTQF